MVETRRQPHFVVEEKAVIELTAAINAHLAIQAVQWAAQHNISISSMVAQALTEYILDVDSGLLTAPRPVLRSLLGRRGKGAGK
jgi:hypothetical protein